MHLKKIIVAAFLAFLGATALPPNARAADLPAVSAAAASAQFGIKAKGVITPRGTCQHKFRVDPGAPMKMRLSGNGKTLLSLYVYDGSGRLIAQRRTRDKPAVINFKSVRSRTLTCVIENHGRKRNKYKLVAR